MPFAEGRVFSVQKVRDPRTALRISSSGWLVGSACQLSMWGRLVGIRRATQDLLALNIDLASVMQGRWKSTRMPMGYGMEVLAARGDGQGG
jgi:hypothetical protein